MGVISNFQIENAIKIIGDEDLSNKFVGGISFQLHEQIYQSCPYDRRQKRKIPFYHRKHG